MFLKKKQLNSDNSYDIQELENQVIVDTQCNLVVAVVVSTKKNEIKNWSNNYVQ